jgi:uncharacterized protein
MKDSAYSLCIRDRRGHYCLFNTRTGAAHLLHSDEFSAYRAIVDGLSPVESAADTLQQLVEGGFLIEDDVDELAQIKSAHIEARTSRETLSLVIAPTMACNLSCRYCFEANRYPGRMSEAKQANIVRLARRYFASGTRRLVITWYGGEPLLAMPVISELSNAFLGLCREFDRDYSADIVTNGMLLTDKTARQLASLKVGRAQVTLDGIPHFHDQRRVSKTQAPTFHRILDGIEAATGHMHVSIRINVCRDSAARLEELLRILATRGLNHKATVYIAPLGRMPELAGTGERRPRKQTLSAVFDDQRIEFLSDGETADLMLRFHDLLAKHGFPTRANILPLPRTTACIGDRDHSWLIEANGDVQKCYWTAGLRDEAVGHLCADGIALRTPRQKWQEWSVFKQSECARCVFLPLCLGLCPLRQLAGEVRCPSFKHNWQRVLAHAFGVADEDVVPVRLPLTSPPLPDHHSEAQPAALHYRRDRVERRNHG